MTLKELYDALTWNVVAGVVPYVKVPSKEKSILCTDEVLKEYGDRIVHDITIVWEKKEVVIFLKATNKEISDAFMEGWLKD